MLTWSLFKVVLARTILPSAALAFAISFLIPRRLVIALSLWAGLVICNLLNSFVPWIPEAWGWEAVLPVSLLGLLLVNFLTLSKVQPTRWWIYRGLAAAAIAALLLVDAPVPWTTRLLLAGFCVAWQLVLESVQLLVPRWLLAGLLGITCLAAAFICLQASAGKPADIALVLSAGLAGLTLSALSRRLDLRIAISLVTMIIPSLLVASRFYSAGMSDSPLGWTSHVLIALAPLTSLLAFLPEKWSNSPRLLFTSMAILWGSILLMGVSLDMLSADPSLAG